MGKIHFDDISEFIFIALAIIIIAAAVIFVVVGFVAIISNSNCRIAEGIVIDKYIGGRYHAKYFMLLQGEKNGKEVEYWREVTEEEYKKYKIGDYYG